MKRAIQELSAAWLGCLLLLFLGVPPRVCAVPHVEKKLTVSAKAYEELRQRYFKLRNTDTKVEKTSDWTSVAAELEAFIELYPRSEEAPAALLNLSNLWEKLYERSKQERVLLQSLAALSRLVREYPKNERADDALLKAAELTELRYHDAVGAARLCEKVLSRYPNSDSAPKARERLKLLRTGAGGQAPFHSSKTKPLGRPDAEWVVVLDPGHGGEDYGAKGPGGLLEKDVVLAVALEAEKLLEQDPSIDVELTRQGDTFVPLAERTKIANEWRADLFLSLHNNASSSGEYSGLQTFYLDMAGDESSKLLAERENGSEVLQGAQGDLAFILSDLTQSAKQTPSISLAHDVHGAVFGATKKAYGNLKDRGVRPGPFYVLVGAHMPCALIELFFVDNPRDGALLAKKEFRAALAQGLARGVRKYLGRGSVRPVVRTSR